MLHEYSIFFLLHLFRIKNQLLFEFAIRFLINSHVNLPVGSQIDQPHISLMVLNLLTLPKTSLAVYFLQQ